MGESNFNSKLIGLLGVIFGILALSSLLVIDRNKLIIPVSDFSIVKYFIIITIVNGGLWFIVVSIGILTGRLPNPADAKNKIEYKEVRAKGFLIGIFMASPFFISLFTTIFVVSTSTFWKILGGCALVYVAWSIYSNVKVFISKRK